MNRLLLCLVVVACAAAGLAQPAPSGSSGSAPYEPAVPRAPAMVGYGGGWPGYAPANTAAGAAMMGMSQVISSAGQYNLATSAAAVNMTQAYRNQLQNDMLATNTYFAMREANRAARERERGPRLTTEQLVKIAHDGAPRPLTSAQEDPITGSLRWPSALQESVFADQRAAVDQMFAKRAAYGGLPYSDQMLVKKNVDAMYAGLKSQIKQIPPQDYVACRDFLRTLNYTAAKSDLQ